MKVPVKMPRKPTLGETFREEVSAAQRRHKDWSDDIRRRFLKDLDIWFQGMAQQLRDDINKALTRVQHMEQHMHYKPEEITYIYHFGIATDAELKGLAGYKIFDQFCRLADIHWDIQLREEEFPNGASVKRMTIVVDPHKPYQKQSDDPEPQNPYTGPSI